ncbi:ComEC family competence protein [Salipiger sp. P9]|uniref:ComEC/Rec2 family competence protein n=1 Tax=Salipiger pentaromativorans TaxID=2943193 RepID=UPI00215809F3|nr:ComEC/Rec2 family competence protein [Salipiger pentaromativorans]MCR8547341.1 ComEC family competence protein [Salipiger pentaromativorans]
MRQIATRLEAGLTRQRGHLFPWVPVALACGIGLYFALPAEPPVWALVLAACVGAGLLALSRRLGVGHAPLVAALALVALGGALAGGRAHQVAGPLLGFRYYGPVEGRVVGIDRSASDALRLTLDRVVLARMAPQQTPQRVRVALHGAQGVLDPSPGQIVILTGHLAPPGGAAEPGGFDFRRHAWFQRLGAVGYTRTPVLLLTPAQGGQWVLRARMWLSARVQAALPGEAGAFAAAIMTGDRSGMGQEALTALRHSNLAHLLAISGLHMGLLAGFVFGAVRLALLLAPQSRHHWPGKKLAAGCALAAAAGYLALSGGNVATERAFVMAAVMLVAVLFDRRALSLRAVALAALIVLLLRPEALLGPGFQMSFAATVALVAVFGALRDRGTERGMPSWARPALALVVSSATASLATAPVAMAHFNLMSHYGLLANLVAVPVMGLLVVPMAVVAALLLPFGLDGLALAVMRPGLDWILYVARGVSGWEGALGYVVAPGPAVLPLLALGALFLCLWQTRLRWAGLAPMALAAASWSLSARPDILIADTGTLVGVLTERGRALSRESGAAFLAGIWLENDGQGGGQAAAAGLWPGGAPERTARIALAGLRVTHLQGKRAAGAFAGCTGPELVVSSVDLPEMPGCDIYDPARLRETGSVAVWLEAKGPRVVTAAGRRLWHGAGAQ